MKRIKAIAVLLITPVLFAGCISGPRISSDGFASGFSGAFWEFQKSVNDDNIARFRTKFPMQKPLR
jgi:hypothetical protein